jgi:hypothetical protein
VEKTIEIGDRIFLVPSITTEGIQYLVDMKTGICQCKIGINGSPCKHQYILWAHKLADGVNFLPVFSKEQRQLYAQIAIEMSLPLQYYEGVHDQVLTLPHPAEQSSDVCNYTDKRDITGTGMHLLKLHVCSMATMFFITGLNILCILINISQKLAWS